MCSLIQLEKTAAIAVDMFPGTVVSISPMFKHERKLKCLLNGRQEFNPFGNRRHSWDIMIHYGLYIQQTQIGKWECGEHNSNIMTTVTTDSPLTSIVEYAHKHLIRNKKY